MSTPPIQHISIMKNLDLVIIGAQKSGTTSLKNYLRQHPQIAGHNCLEFAYFGDDSEYAQGYEAVANEYLDKKVAPVYIAKNVAISLSEEPLRRLQKHNPAMKVVLVLREPASRSYSEYTMGVMDGWMKRDFSELNDILEEGNTRDPMYQCFIPNGFYVSQIQLILKYFPPENIRIFLFDDLKQVPDKICNNLFEWLGVDYFRITPEIHNKTVKPRSMKVASFTHRFRKQGNPVKMMLKALLPRHVFEHLRNAVLKANFSREAFPPLSPKLKRKLTEHYAPSIKELVDLIHRSAPESLIMFGASHWLQLYDQDELSE